MIQMKGRSKRAVGQITGIMGALIFLLCLFPTGAWANAPKAVKLDYNLTGQTLQVTITHSSMFPKSHYIKKVEIKKNGNVVLTKDDYQGQPDAPAFAYTYPVQAAAGDVLEVTATCSWAGSKTEKITVAQTAK